MENIAGKKSERSKKKTAVILIRNEVVSCVLAQALRGIGYEMRHDMESCIEADFAMIDPYFSELGILNQLCLVHPRLPVVLITHSGYKVSGNGKFFYDIVELDGRSAIETDEKIAQWFSEGQGKYLIQKGGSWNSCRT